MPENYLLVGLIEKYSGILLDNNGSIRPEGIRLVFELEDLKVENDIIEKMVLYVNHAKIAQRTKS